MSKTKGMMEFVRTAVLLAVVVAAGVVGYKFYQQQVKEKEILKQMVRRLTADSRIAEVVVTNVDYNPILQKHMTTIKFLEYDSDGLPMWPQYYTFAGNIIQFQSLVVRFADDFVKGGDKLRGKSVYLFWKAFVLDGQNTQEYEITKTNEVPDGYKIGASRNKFEEEIWHNFWDYALKSDKAIKKGIKNAQIEAPGTKFVPGILYTLKIEHDGGIRIDTQQIPEVLRGEKMVQ